MIRVPLLVALLATGCLSVPNPSVPACTSNADCNSGAGEVCEEGVCWGDPPNGTFAGTISPPSEREDLVPLEIAMVGIPDDGWMGDLNLESPVMFSGRVQAFCVAPADCTGRASLDATITITRPSQFHGGPGFRTVVTSQGDFATGTSFQVALPRTHETESPYTITIVPGGRSTPGTVAPTAAELVPPLRTELVVAASATGKIIELGQGPLATLEGTLTGVGGLGLADYRVVALGHWDATAPLGEVSTVDYTGVDGHYVLTLADGLAGTVELVAKPRTDTVVGPTLHIANVDPTRSGTRNLNMPANLGSPRHVKITVRGADSSGKVHPLAGARVSVVARVKPQITSDLFASAVSEITTGEDGIAVVDMFDGEAMQDSYRLQVVPPASSNVGALFDGVMSLKDTEIKLPNRVALGGTVVDSRGTPLGGVSVSAHPALRFTWSLEDAPQKFLSEIPAASTVTTPNGEFVVWVDPVVAATWGSYDLVFEPKADSRSASWTVTDVALPRDTALTSISLDPITIPDAAFVHGRIADPDGLDLEGAELKLFKIETSLALCSEVVNAPPSCPIPAVLQGRGSSIQGGIVRLTLPRP